VIRTEPSEYDRREGTPIYTRNYGRADRGGVRYSPPPGYDGNAFTEPPAVKMHPAQDELVRLPPKERVSFPEEERPEPEEMEVGETEEAGERKPSQAEVRTKPVREEDSSEFPEEIPVFTGGIQSLEALFRHLRGKFGREELIIVLVMLLVSSEGASLELILLALLLISG